jgi:hypothetical protein
MVGVHFGVPEIPDLGVLNHITGAVRGGASDTVISQRTFEQARETAKMLEDLAESLNSLCEGYRETPIACGEYIDQDGSLQDAHDRILSTLISWVNALVKLSEDVVKMEGIRDLHDTPISILHNALHSATGAALDARDALVYHDFKCEPKATRRVFSDGARLAAALRGELPR